MSALGQPRVHYRLIGSTNARARKLAAAGVPHGAVVTAGEQSAGRGRQGRTWLATAGRALLCSVVVRDPPALLPLAAGVAVAEVAGTGAQLKWPNDVLVAGRKVAGILVEGRPQEGWAVVGIGLNVAVQIEDLPAELRSSAGTLGFEPDAIEPTLAAVLARLGGWLVADAAAVVAAIRERDALLGCSV
ncbi:MAG TPA: biotin--[acetyl-CoA-carboxylase] ligase, partial [Solirubrobacteraceae bacterium]|nr:biotin--[acetyl-CoA-carboxylase] ligase [Solirubrobacteraceae bacterium]